jgi:hypothetical protein
LTGYSQVNSDTSKVNVFQDFSLQFQVRLLELTSFQGGLISFKYHFNNHVAFRSGVGLSYDNSDSEEEREVFFEDSTIFNAKSKNENVTISIPAQLLYYINPDNDVKVFLGLGPYITYMVSNAKNTDYRYSNNYYGSVLIELATKYYSIGLSSAYGVEWFFTDNMSLTGEYGFTFSYYYRETRLDRLRIYPESDNYIENSFRKSEGWRFNSTGVLFGLSIYL